MNQTTQKKIKILDTSKEPIHDDLEYINRNFAFGLKGIDNNSEKSKPRNKYPLIYALVSKIFEPYISAGVRFRSSIVRIINELAQSRKINFSNFEDEIDLKINNKIEENFKNNSLVINEINERIKVLESWKNEIDLKINQLDSVSKGIESFFISLSKNSSSISSKDNKENNHEIENITVEHDPSYLFLENRYRGSEELISSRMIPHAERIDNLIKNIQKNDNNPSVIEIGCGRGELLEQLRERGLSAVGVEMDGAMVKRCQDKGLSVVSLDANSYLKSLKSKSVNCIVAIQVVEHLSNEYRKEFFELVKTRLVNGGIFVLETINTSSFLPLLHNYFRDPTHIFPLHPDTLKTLIEYAGFTIKDVVYSSEYPDEVKLQLIDEQNGMPPRYNEMVKQINSRFSQINSLFYGSQDYTIIATTRG